MTDLRDKPPLLSFARPSVVFISGAIGFIAIRFLIPPRWAQVGVTILFWTSLVAVFIKAYLQQLDKQLGDGSGVWVDEVKRRLASGDKLGAAQVVRESTNLGFAEAQVLVDSWAERIR